MSSFESLDPEAARIEIDRAAGRVRRARWWYVAGAVIMSVSNATFYFGMIAYRDRVEDFIVPGLLAVLAVLLVLAWRQRTVDRGVSRAESHAVWTTIGLATLAAVLAKFAVPEGLTVWAVLVGVLPAVPFAVLAWKVARR